MSACRPRLRCGVLLLLSALPAALAGQDPIPPEADVAFLDLRYDTYVATVVSAVHHRGEFLLPLAEVFGHLRLDARVDVAAGVATGFFLSPDRRYVLDFRAGTGRVAGQTIDLPPGSAYFSDTDVYVRLPLLEEAFGLAWLVEMATLTLQVRSPEPLPVAAAVQRERRRARLAAIGPRAHAPLLHDRDRRWLDGGVIQYSASAIVAGSDAVVLPFSIVAGGEILGGDVFGALNAAYMDGFVPGQSRWRWRYAVDREGLLPTQLLVGDLFGTGLRQREFAGVRVTNAPVRPRVLLGEHHVHGVTRPDWEVELFVHDQLVAHTVADPTGAYTFAIPLVYGSSTITLRHYGPTGEVHTERRRLDVPSDFVPRGTIEYDASGGVGSLDRAGTAQGSVAVGVTEWLTTRVGAEWVDDRRHDRPVPYTATTARLAGNLLATVRLAPGVSSRASGRAVFPSNATVHVAWERWEESPVYNIAGIREQVIGGLFLPLRQAGAPITLRGQALRTDFLSGRRNDALSADLSATTGPLRTMVQYRRTVITPPMAEPAALDEATVGILLRPQLRAPWLPRGMIVSGSATYDPGQGALTQARLGLSGSVGRHGRLHLQADRHVRLDMTRAEVRYQLDLPTVRSTSSVAVQDGRPQVTQAVRGSVGFHRSGIAAPSQREWVGGAGVLVRTFVDENGNGRYDPGEEVLDHVRVRIHQATGIERMPSGMLRAEGLIPYERYSVEVDESSIRNPFHVPMVTRFSFIADPNRYKLIDIPFRIGGVVEGQVIRRVAGTDRPGGGIDVEIVSTDGTYQVTVRSFADGSLYFMGIPPGDYEARVAPAHLALLGVAADPEVRRFRVRPDPDGDFVRGLDFVLLSPD